MDVGVRELKAKLSEYLREVKEGGEVIVTERGTPVAKIVPFSDPDLLRAFEEGRIRPPLRLGGLPSLERTYAPKLSPIGKTVQETLDEDRGK